MAVKFDSHRYAIEQLRTRKLAYEGGLLYVWQDSHWVPVDDDRGERRAYAWIVRNDRGFANPVNAKVKLPKRGCGGNLGLVYAANAYPSNSWGSVQSKAGSFNWIMPDITVYYCISSVKLIFKLSQF